MAGRGSAKYTQYFALVLRGTSNSTGSNDKVLSATGPVEDPSGHPLKCIGMEQVFPIKAGLCNPPPPFPPFPGLSSKTTKSSKIECSAEAISQPQNPNPAQARIALVLIPVILYRRIITRHFMSTVYVVWPGSCVYPSIHQSKAFAERRWTCSGLAGPPCSLFKGTSGL